MKLGIQTQNGLVCSVIFCSLLLFIVGNVNARDSKGDSGSKGVQASAFLYSCDNPTEPKGFAILREKWSEEGVKEVVIMIKVSGLPEGKHAVHIHETAACEPCGAAGGHFDPGPFGFTSPDGNHPYHSGDLINIDVKKNGKGMMKTVTSRITLSEGPLSIFDEDGSAFIIHVDPDSYCPDGEESGCAGGARAACGIIELDS